MQKLVRITTIPLSLEKLLEGQLSYMNDHYEVIAVSAEKNRLENYGKNNKVRTFWVEMTRAITPWKDLKSLWRFYNFLKREKPFIIHSHTPKAGIIGMLAGKMAGVPVRLHTVAGLPLLEVKGTKRKLLDAVEKLTYRLATRVYPNSFELRKIVLQLKYAEEAKLRVLGEGSSNGIDTTYFQPSLFNKKDNIDLKSELGIPEKDFIFIFVGRLVREKGINELVRAFIKLQSDRPNSSLLLVGPFEQELDPLDKEVFRIIEENPKIYTTGYQQDVRPYFSIADVLTFPSYREGFPNVVMQANAMNLPAIVTNINGCNEIVEEGVNGVIIPVKNESKILQSMRRLMDDRELCSILAHNARELIQKKYERTRFWNILLKEYKELEVLHKHD
ncbi:glycosyltransferase family 4 protein [Christiangramia echinicola]|uniref:Glycosyltransferase involved in cell wall bisynthesis n=1 Tax=Christiangramia echinicola TaxID=279359 RepID=A0A1H1QR10_9FLAO|nr:glycosyltransferase family 4 protein [Christiangramia echinicola]SDS25835.1 Glycosyltransferase involved in cell wall bisynthesis [Christiangramia echinicola]